MEAYLLVPVQLATRIVTGSLAGAAGAVAWLP
jgi:hypothetical protein